MSTFWHESMHMFILGIVPTQNYNNPTFAKNFIFHIFRVLNIHSFTLRALFCPYTLLLIRRYLPVCEITLHYHCFVLIFPWRQLLLATSVYTWIACSNLQWSITWTFLPQICTILEVVLVQLHAMLTPGTLYKKFGQKYGVGTLSWDYGIYNQNCC